MATTTTPDEDAFLQDLVGEGLLLESGVPGVYGRHEAFEHVLLRFDALVTRETKGDGADVVRFPPVLPRHTLESTGYLSSFPHLAGSVFSFAGDEEDAIELGARAGRHENWSELQEQTEVSLLPAACYPVYPWVAQGGPMADGGRLVDVCCYCFRNEPSRDPARMQAFRQREHVRIGTPDEVAGWHRDWIERGTSVLASVGLHTETVVASDPFFGRAGRMLSANQRDQGLKLELVHPIATDKPAAIMSINNHQDHFGLDFGIRTSDGGTAHTACFGFGLERITLALFRVHGLDTGRWPSEVREDRLRLDEEA
jgi:seryl-tRNA synthetase